MVTEESRTALSAALALSAHQVFVSDDWVVIASELLASGEESPAILELACLTSPASGWEVDALRAQLVDELRLEPMNDDDVARFVAQVLVAEIASRPSTVNYPLTRALSALYVYGLHCPLTSDCFVATEYLDCECGTGEKPEDRDDDLTKLGGADLPPGVFAVFANRLRNLIPLRQPHYGHR